MSEPDSVPGTDASQRLLLVANSDGTATITLNRATQRNPLNWATVRALGAEVKNLEGDPAVKVVFIRGAGGNFSAGGDMIAYVDLYRRPDDFETFLRDFHGMLNAIEDSEKIYVAVIEGYCVAGGLELLLACDIVVAAQSAHIGDAHLKFGQLPGAGGSQRLPRTVGLLRAKYLGLSGDVLEAAEAERIGLVSKVVDDGELDAHIAKLASRLLQASPLGLKGIKYLANKGVEMERSAAMEMEIQYVRAYATESFDATEGLMAFQEKRRPRFTGK